METIADVQKDAGIKIYPRRPGSDDMGRDYEIRITALLSLRCAAMEDTKNMWLGSNVDQVGDFDDIVLCKHTTKGEHIAYMIQLKHQENPKNITQHDLNYSSKTVGKREKSKTDFSLVKYSKGFIELKQTLAQASSDEELEIIRYLRNVDRAIFVLYTNKGVNECEFLENVQDSALDLLNTTTSQENLYKFNPSKLSYDSDFLQQLILFTNQIHLNQADNLIKKEIKSLLSSLNVANVDLASLTDEFINFIKTWAKGGDNKKSKIFYMLTKSDIIHKLIELMLEPYQLNFSRDPYTFYDCPQKHIWNEICDKSALIDYDEAAVEFLKQYLGSELRKHCFENKKNWADHVSQQFQSSFSKNHPNFLILENATLFDVYLYLCFDYTLPLLLQINEVQDYQNISKILKLSPKIRVIVVNNDTVGVPPKKDCFVSLRDLSNENQAKILNQSVNLQGRSSIILSELLDNSMYKFLKCKDIIKVLLHAFSIGNAYTPLSDYLIERSLSKIFLDRDILRELKNDLFVIQNDASFVNDNYGNIISNADLERRKSQQKTVHVLNYFNGFFFEWKDTFGNIQNVRRFQTKQPYKNSDLITIFGYKDTLWTPLKDIMGHNVRIISSNPGSGKTILMNIIAKRAPIDFWVLKISLNEHEEYYDEFGNADMDEHLNYFSGKDPSENQELSGAVFRKFVKKKKVLLLLDGFDEISIIHKNEVTKIIKSFHEGGFKMFITTRPVMKTHLEEIFNTLSINLKPFTSEDQEKYLMSYYTPFTKSPDQLKIFLPKFAKELLQAAQSNFYSLNNKEFMGIPLQTQLLAEVFSDDYKKSLKANLVKFNKRFDLLYLLAEFTKKKIDIFCSKYGKDAKRTRVIFKKHQELFSLKIIFQKESRFDIDPTAGLNLEKELEELYENKTEQMQFLQREGVVVPTSDGSKLKFNVNFVHRTFAEYTAAQWLVENFKNEDKNVRATAKLLINARFEPLSPNRFLFRLFDCLLVKGCQSHLDVINRRIEEIKENVDDLDVEILDKGGRSILHLIAMNGFVHPQSYYSSIKKIDDDMLEIIEKIPEIPDLKDKLLGYNPLDYAIASNCLGVANKFLEKNPYLTLNVNVHSFKKDRYFTYCTVLGYEALFKFLVPHFAARDILIWNNVSQDVIIQSYCRLVENNDDDQDVKDRNFYSYINKFGVETLGELFMFKYKDIEAPFSDYYADLRFAVAYGSVVNVELLLGQGFDANEQDFDLNTPLHYASQRKRVQVVHLLLAEGAEVNKPGNEGNAALHNAAESGHNEVVEELLSYGAQLNQLNDSKQTPLHLAVLRGRLNTANLLLLNGANSDVESKDGNSLLHYAAMKGATDIMSVLFARETQDVNKQNRNGWTPLHFASEGHSEAAKLLLSNGADCNIQDSNGNTPLHQAAASDNIDIISEFLAHNPDINKQNKEQETPLHLASTRYLNTVKLLLCNGADPDVKNRYGYTALIIATQKNQIDIVSELLAANADVNAVSNANISPLNSALTCHNTDLAKLFLSNNADVYSKDSLGNSTLHYAVSIGNTEIALELLAKGVDINAGNTFKSTPLHSSISYGHVDTAKLLLSSGARWNIENVDGNIPLHFAARLGNVELISEFLSRGENINKQNSEGQTPLHDAVKNGNAEAVELLVANSNIKVDVQNIYGKSPLHSSIIDISLRRTEDCNGYVNCVRLLLEKEAIIDLKDNEGNTPLHYACEKKSEFFVFDRNKAKIIISDFYCKVVSLLLKKGADANLTNKDGNKALDLAVAAGYTEMVDIFQQNTSNIS